MTINDAIKHCEDVAAKQCNNECGLEHKQLADWLRELINLRQEHIVKESVWKTNDILPTNIENKNVLIVCLYLKRLYIGYFCINPFLGERYKCHVYDGDNGKESLDWNEQVELWAFPQDIFPKIEYNGQNPLYDLRYDKAFPTAQNPTPDIRYDRCNIHIPYGNGVGFGDDD